MQTARENGATIAPAGSTTEPEPELTDEQWLLIADLFPAPEPSPLGGRPRASLRSCCEGIIWVLRTGARWKDLPRCFPSPSTCWRRFDEWTSSGLWEHAWSRLLRRLDARGKIDTKETSADGTFASAKKGANASARPNAAKARRSWSSPMRAACRLPRTSLAPVLTK